MSSEKLTVSHKLNHTQVRQSVCKIKHKWHQFSRWLLFIWNVSVSAKVQIRQSNEFIDTQDFMKDRHIHPSLLLISVGLPRKICFILDECIYTLTFLQVTRAVQVFKAPATEECAITSWISLQYQPIVYKWLSFNLLQPTWILWSLFDDTLPDLWHMWTGITRDTWGLQDLSGTRLFSPPVGPHASSPNTWTPICPFPDLTVHYEQSDGEKDTQR